MGLRNFSILLLTGFSLIISTSCKKDNDEAAELAKLNAEIKEWMYDAMDEVYFWSSTLPSFSTVENITDPGDFFTSLIYQEEDRWSWFTDDYTSLMNDFAGTPTSMGISPVFGKYSDSDQVFILISYVYPGSPADRAGIKRGDIIMKINGLELNTTNYYELYNLNSFSVNLGHYFAGSISTSSTQISISAEVIDSNPVVFDTILSINEHKIGYIAYVEFISGENDVLLNDFGVLVDEFNSQGVTELVVDIRYNPGGEIDVANYLGSCLAPSAVVSSSEIFVKFIYNPLVQIYFETYYGENSSNLVNRFADNGHNINLNRIFFLTGENSASASELLIIGLRPYMDVVHIGDSTYGKFTGAWVLSDTNEPPKHNWAIVPIVSKYSNAEGLTDFGDGLVPDYLVPDNLFEAEAFGSLADPMLAKAVELITGQVVGTKKSSKPLLNYEILPNPARSVKSNLFLPQPGLFVPFLK